MPDPLWRFRRDDDPKKGMPDKEPEHDVADGDLLRALDRLIKHDDVDVAWAQIASSTYRDGREVELSPINKQMVDSLVDLGSLLESEGVDAEKLEAARSRASAVYDKAKELPLKVYTSQEAEQDMAGKREYNDLLDQARAMRIRELDIEPEQ